MRSDPHRIWRGASLHVSALRWAACSLGSAGVLCIGGATGSDARAALGSPRDGKSWLPADDGPAPEPKWQMTVGRL